VGLGFIRLIISPITSTKAPKRKSIYDPTVRKAGPYWMDNLLSVNLYLINWADAQNVNLIHFSRINMRIACLLILVIIAVLEISPVPITPLVLIWIVLFRPSWFYNLVLKIYEKK
jgi:hypothetical protein